MSHKWIHDLDASLTLKDALRSRWREKWRLVRNTPDAWHTIVTITYPAWRDPREFTWHLPIGRARHFPVSGAIEENPLECLVNGEMPLCPRCLKDAFTCPLGMEPVAVAHWLSAYFRKEAMYTTPSLP